MPHVPDCHVCGGALLALDGYPVAHQVTSDCRPWVGEERLAVCSECETVQKPVTENWLREVQEIYSGYAAYRQGGGVEQASFDQSTGASSARSQKIVEWLQENGTSPKTGVLLDIGCGNGGFLRSFGRNNPQWQMVGLELDSRNVALVEAIPGVVKLHVGPIGGLKIGFDLVVLIHALEHMPDPIHYLRSLSGLLNPGGLLLIEVPDLEASPFDILIADHCTHFSSDTLRWVVGQAGFDTIQLSAGCVAKELTLLARFSGLPSRAFSPSGAMRGASVAKVHVAWLDSLLQQGRSIPGCLGVFGSSISSTWLAAALGDRVRFLVDEDPNRAGRTHLGYPICSPEDAPDGSTVLMPLRPDIAAAVARRLSRHNLQFIIPPSTPPGVAWRRTS